MFSSVSQPCYQPRSLTSRSRTPATIQYSLPVSCLVTRHFFRAVHFTHQLLLDTTLNVSGGRLHSSLSPGQHYSRSPCASRLNQYVLTAVKASGVFLPLKFPYVVLKLSLFPMNKLTSTHAERYRTKMPLGLEFCHVFPKFGIKVLQLLFGCGRTIIVLRRALLA